MGVGTNYQESGNKANQAAGLCVWGGGLGETDHKRKKPTVVFSDKKILFTVLSVTLLIFRMPSSSTSQKIFLLLIITVNLLLLLLLLLLPLLFLALLVNLLLYLLSQFTFVSFFCSLVSWSSFSSKCYRFHFFSLTALTCSLCISFSFYSTAPSLSPFFTLLLSPGAASFYHCDQSLFQ
jgi:hypothetical protein